MISGDRPGVCTLDCHVHTADSYDSTASVESVLEHASAAGLSGLVITDHDRITRSLRAVDLAPTYGLIALPGVEVSTAAGHLLAIGVTSCPPAGEPLLQTVRRVRDDGGVAVVPHPFQRTRHGASAAAIADCDGIEVFNAHTLTGIRNTQAKRFALTHEYPQFGGSDAHRPETVGSGVTHVDTGVERPDAADVLAALRAGRTRARGRPTSPRRYLGKLAECVRRNGHAIR